MTAPPLVVREPNSSAPLPQPMEWDGAMEELAKVHDVLVPTARDLAELTELLPDWGILCVMVPGIAVHLCPFTLITGPEGGPIDGYDYLESILVADIGDTSLFRTRTGVGDIISWGSATQIAPEGNVLFSTAMAWQRDHGTFVVLSTTSLTPLNDVMPRILLGLAEPAGTDAERE